MRKHLLAGISAFAILLGFAGAATSGVPVTDSAVIAAANRTAHQTAEQLKRLNDIKATTEDVLASIGSAGEGLYDLNRMPDWASFASGGDYLKGLASLAPDACMFDGCADGGNGTADFSTLEGARTFVAGNLYMNALPSTDQARDLKEARVKALREANLTAYSLALMGRSHLAQSAARASALDSIVNSASDLRGDVRANSGVVLAVHQDVIGLQAVLTALLESEAAASIAGDYELVGKDGGASAPDAYKEDNFTVEGIRRGTADLGGGGSFTDRLTRSAGGSGLEGLIEANKDALGAATNDASTMLTLAGAAAAKDGNSVASDAYNALTEGINSGAGLDRSVLDSAAVTAKSSGSAELSWLVEAGRYGAGSGNYRSSVDAGDKGQVAMVEAMIDVADTLADAAGNNEHRAALNRVRSAVRDGEITDAEAANIAMRIGAESVDSRDTAKLIDIARRAATGSSSKRVALDVIKVLGAEGDTVRLVNDVLRTTGVN